jgi:hypothetical protein
MKEIFNYKDDIEGKIGIGKLPKNLENIINSISKKYNYLIPNKNASTYHTWFCNMSPSIKKKVRKIQNNKFWRKLCDGNTKCRIFNTPEVDELYYSKAPAKKDASSLKYGAATNFDLHGDGMFQFPGITFIRVIIGLTSGNTSVKTVFPSHEKEAYLNKDKFIAFDFDKAPHQVVNTSNDNSNYRTMLKLHFCVCTTCDNESLYFKGVSNMYVLYETITRYIMTTGTNPTTLYEFFLGLLCNAWAFYPGVLKLYFVLFLAWLVLRTKRKKRIPALTYIVGGGAGIFMSVVVALWLRFLITGKR